MIDGVWGLLLAGGLLPVIAVLGGIVARQGSAIRLLRTQFGDINKHLDKVLTGTDQILTQQAPIVGLAEGLLGALVKVTQSPPAYPGAPATTQIQIQAPVDRVTTGGASFGAATLHGPVAGRDAIVDNMTTTNEAKETEST